MERERLAGRRARAAAFAPRVRGRVFRLVDGCAWRERVQGDELPLVAAFVRVLYLGRWTAADRSRMELCGRGRRRAAGLSMVATPDVDGNRSVVCCLRARGRRGG